MDGVRDTGGLLLAVDTTGERCSAAIYDPSSSAILAAAEPEIGKGHAERLMDVIAEVVSRSGAAFHDLSRLAVAIGPGSFTGIRVGVSAVRGLALALGRPAVGVDVLEALAEPHLDLGDPVLAVQDARRGEVYAALYDPGGSIRLQPQALRLESLGDIVSSAAPGPLGLVGSGAAIAAQRLREARILSAAPQASIGAVARIAARRGPGLPVRPLYLRQADAKPSSTPSLVRAS